LDPVSDEVRTRRQSQRDIDVSPSDESRPHQGKDALENNIEELPNWTLRSDPFGLDWTGWPDMAVDPLGFPVLQPDLYDLGINFDDNIIGNSNLVQPEPLARE
jgi:hypothetical protein